MAKSKKKPSKQAKRRRELEKLRRIPPKKKCCRSDPRCKRCPVRIKKRVRKLEAKLGED
ncbi:hypothetical protein HJD18_15125 [Thermoleophilia bacterium SCSIO 60948]|nr:hypothetical protein HJD18_15125 [Thermoleophilia bacterium SCSIO 60948]